MRESESLDTLAPELKVFLGGDELPEDVYADLIAVTVFEDVEATGMCGITLQSQDSTEMKPVWLDDERFDEGGEIKIEMGYHEQLEAVFAGEITGLEPEFTSSRPPSMTIRGHDRRHRMMRDRRTQTFLEMTDSQIAEQLAGDAGLTPNVEDSGVTLEYVVQHNQTDLEFLQMRASRIGYELLVDDRDFYFRRRQLDAGDPISLQLEMELLEFTPRLTTLNQSAVSRGLGWDPKRKEALEAENSSSDVAATMEGASAGPAAAEEAFGSSASLLVDHGVQTQDELDQIVGARMEEMALSFVRGHGLCIGNAKLRAGKLIEIEELGRRFSGLYYLMSVEHHYRPSTGYRTRFTAWRNSRG